MRGGTPPTMKPQSTYGRAASSCHPERSEGSVSITAAQQISPPREPHNLPLLGKGDRLRWMRRFTFPFRGRGTVLCTVDEAIYLVPALPPPTSPERDDPAEPDHKGENSRLSYQLSVMSYERSARFSAPPQLSRSCGRGKGGDEPCAAGGGRSKARKAQRSNKSSMGAAAPRRLPLGSASGDSIRLRKTSSGDSRPLNSLGVVGGDRGGQGEF